MDLQADRLTDVSKVVSCWEADEFLEEDKDEDGNERFVNTKEEELTYLSFKQFAHKTSKCVSNRKCRYSISRKCSC